MRGLLDVSDFPGRIGACEWDGSRFPVPLQLLSGEHLRLPVGVNQGADLCWHLWVTDEKPEKRFMTSFHLFLHKRAHLKRNLEAFFLWFKIGNLERRFERANLEVSPPPWPRQCSLRKPQESIPSLAPSSRQGSNRRWEPYDIPRTLFS